MFEEKESEDQEREEPAKEEKTGEKSEGEAIPKEKLGAINIDSTNQYIRKISTIDH